jgi:hypothetical protein
VAVAIRSRRRLWLVLALVFGGSAGFYVGVSFGRSLSRNCTSRIALSNREGARMSEEDELSYYQHRAPSPAASSHQAAPGPASPPKEGQQPTSNTPVPSPAAPTIIRRPTPGPNCPGPGAQRGCQRCSCTAVEVSGHRSSGDVAAAAMTQTRHWAVVFPFHGLTNGTRIRAAHAAWLSLCHAMRHARSQRFHVIALDDTGQIAKDCSKQQEKGSEGASTSAHCQRHATWLKRWRAACTAPNLLTLERVRGAGAIGRNILTGYRWASQHDHADLIMNLDSDMLLAQDFFALVSADLTAAHAACETPVVSGYSSQKWRKAFGANFVFSKATFGNFVERVSAEIEWDGPWCASGTFCPVLFSLPFVCATH